MHQLLFSVAQARNFPNKSAQATNCFRARSCASSGFPSFPWPMRRLFLAKQESTGQKLPKLRRQIRLVKFLSPGYKLSMRRRPGDEIFCEKMKPELAISLGWRRGAKCGRGGPPSHTGVCREGGNARTLGIMCKL